MTENNKKVNFSPTSQNESSSKPSFRDWIGLGILIISGVIIIILINLGYKIVPTSNLEFTNIKELFGILLPVIGTWVGTILAYYFSKENFEVANRNVRDLVRQVTSTEEKLQELKVSDVMLKPQDFTLKIVNNYDEFKKCNIKELIDEMDKTHSERLPVLEKDTLKFIFLIYRTTLERFMLGYSNHTIELNDKSTPKITDLTIQNMFDSNYQLAKDIIELTAKKLFLHITATLAEARQLMQDNTICQDVFITKTGNKDEKIEGWLTNNIIIEKSELFKKAGAKF